MRTKLLAKTVIFDEQGRVLLLTRSKTDNNRPGQLDYPGGKVDPGEDAAEGASREIREEIGITVKPQDLRLFYAQTEMADDISVTRLVYWVQLQSPRIQLSHEHDAFHWTPAQQAAQEFPHHVYGVGLAYGLQHNLFKLRSSN